MGLNNRQRRAAKQRKRAHERRQTAHRPVSDEPEDGALKTVAESAVLAAVHRLCRAGVPSQTDANWVARSLLQEEPGVSLPLMSSAVAALVARQVARVISGGWRADEVEELVRRRLGVEPAECLAQVSAQGTLAATESAVACGLRIVAILEFVPLGTPILLPDAQSLAQEAAAEAALSAERTKKLATVRGLLAKAERTTFDEEAEALSAKAQELISRYALERLVTDGNSGASGARTVATLRVWLDAPYLKAKASLVNAVADANRCRAVFSEMIGVCTVVGDRGDLDAVDMLSTSLMVQANRALLRHGEQRDHYGVSRTRSFRQSFLVSFASRIGQRLREANAQTVDDSVHLAANDLPPGQELVRLLADQQERVGAAFKAMFPRVSSTQASVSNSAGWLAGTAAAEAASLGVHGRIAAPVGSQTR